MLEDDGRLADILLTLLNDAEAANRLAASGRTFVQEKFTQEAFARSLVGVYDRLLNVSRRAS